MNLIIITGLSGAGKSQAVKAMEDLGFFCIDNIPPELIPKFAEIYYRSSGNVKRAAIVSDIRGGDMFSQITDSLDELNKAGYEYEILFLEAADNVLIKRYKETRRKHPLAEDGRVTEAVAKEREILKGVRSRAKHVIDTSNLLPAQLREHIFSIYNADNHYEGIVVNVTSFGFKHGIPLDSDLVFDVRFLPNPFYISELKPKTGLDKPVADYVMKFEQTREFLGKLTDMIEYLLPHYIEEGKSQLVISIGCTGGQHRSVTIAEELYRHLKEFGHHAVITHRDADGRR